MRTQTKYEVNPGEMAEPGGVNNRECGFKEAVCKFSPSTQNSAGIGNRWSRHSSSGLGSQVSGVLIGGVRYATAGRTCTVGIERG